VVFVAVDENGTPIPVPPFVPQTEEQKRIAKYALDVKAALDAIVELKPDEIVKRAP
jgi:acyl-CoA hydrolase